LRPSQPACIVVCAVGAKTALLALCEGDVRQVLRARPPLDRDAAKRFAEQVTGRSLEFVEDGTFGDSSNPPDGMVFARSVPGLGILCDGSVAIDKPSKIPASYTRVSGRRVVVHAMHSVVDWFAFGVWDGGTLVRALSLSPDHGVLEDIGTRLPFEVPFWEGEHPVDEEGDQDEVDAYPLPFHPLELGEEALNAFFGLRLEGVQTEIDPFEVAMAGFRVARGPSFSERLRGWLS
jgi:hypothetical protein